MAGIAEGEVWRGGEATEGDAALGGDRDVGNRVSAAATDEGREEELAGRGELGDESVGAAAASGLDDTAGGAEVGGVRSAGDIEIASGVNGGGGGRIEAVAAEVSGIGDDGVDGKGVICVVSAEGEGGGLAVEVPAGRDKDAAAGDGLESDGGTLVDVAVGVGQDEFAGAGEAGRRVGEEEADAGGVGVGGENEIVFEELGAGVEDDIDAGVEIGVANGGGVREVVGPLGGVGTA